MYRVAKSILKQDVDCADAIQETILKAYRQLHTLRDPKLFKAWLMRILVNQCRTILKAQKRMIPTVELVERSATNDGYQEVEIREMVDALHEELRVVITLYYLQDIPVKQIAQILDQPEGTIKSRLSRARTELSRMLGLKKKGESMHESL
ncbi:sigma-70 family RNA polymerase sigma factor [Brevibacillus sp. SYP-B805]|nr:sigma-70 family RNA polymerase sigma factor [Brevibacillus sp. SYP-B805]